MRLWFEVHGCREGSCELLVLNDLLTRGVREEAMPFFTGRHDYELGKSILEYDYLNISTAPAGPILESFITNTDITCYCECEVTTPLLMVKKATEIVYPIHVSVIIDTR